MREVYRKYHQRNNNMLLKNAGRILVVFMVAAVITLGLDIEVITEQRAPDSEYECTLKRLENLEQLALEFDQEQADTLSYVYVRCKTYHSLAWVLMAGALPEAFEDFVKEHKSWNVEKLQQTDNLELPNGESCDMVHLFAVLNMIEMGEPVVGGWGGDLVQLASSMKAVTGEFDTLLAEAKKRLGSVNSSFNHIDILADMDAVNLYNRKAKSGEFLWKNMKEYYDTVTMESRSREFLEYTFGGIEENLETEFDRETLRKQVYQTFMEDTWVKRLCINYKIDDKRFDEHKRAAAYAWADYCYDACESGKIDNRR